MDLNQFYNASEDELLSRLNQFKEENGETSNEKIDKFIREKYKDYNSILSLYDDCGCGEGQYEDYMFYKTKVEQVLLNLLRFIKCANNVGVPINGFFKELVAQEIDFEETMYMDFKRRPKLSSEIYNLYKEISLNVNSVDTFYTLYFMTGDIEYLSKCIAESTYEQLIELYREFKASRGEYEVVINNKPRKMSDILTHSNYPLYILEGENYNYIYESLIKQMVQRAGHNEINEYSFYDYNIKFSIFEVLKQAWEIGYFKNADEFVRYALDRQYYSLVFADEMKEEELWLDFASDELLLEMLEVINCEKEKCLASGNRGKLSYLIDQEIQVFLGLKNPNFKGVENILSRFNTKTHLGSWIPIAKRLLDCENVNVDLFKSWVQVFFRNEKMFKCDEFAGSDEFQDFINDLPKAFNQEKQALEMWRYGRYCVPTQVGLKKSSLNSEWSFYNRTGYFKKEIDILGSDWTLAANYLIDDPNGKQLPEFLEIDHVKIPLDTKRLGCSKRQLYDMISSSFWRYSNLCLWCIRNEDNSIQAVEVSGGDGVKVTNRIDRLISAFNDVCVNYFKAVDEREKKLNGVIDVIASSYASGAMYDASLLKQFEEAKQLFLDNERELKQKLADESFQS